jgi:hypothetical protein
MKHPNSGYLRRIWISSIIVLLLFSSCWVVNPSHHYAYAPSGVNAPFLKEKQQLRLSGNFTIGSNDENSSNDFSNYGIHLKTAYAITDHFGVAAAFFSSREKDKYNWNRDEAKSISYRRVTGEISAGYFTVINKKPNLYFECYGGYGPGGNSLTEKYKQSYYLAGGFYKSNYSQFFIQPAIVVHHKNLLQAGIFLRTALIKYSNIRTNYTNDILQDSYVRLFNPDKEPFVFLQPAASIRVPLSKAGNLHLNLEVNGSFKISGPAIYSREAVALLGITFSPSFAVKSPQ